MYPVPEERTVTRRHRPLAFDPQSTREAWDDIMTDIPAHPAAPPRVPPVPAQAPVPVRVHSPYYWSPPSLLSGLVSGALPELTAPAWKVVSVIAMAQLNAAALGPDASHSTQPVDLSLADLCAATGLARVTVIAAIRTAVKARWLTQEKRRTPHGGNAVALYGINWKRAEQAERARRKTAGK